MTMMQNTDNKIVMQNKNKMMQNALNQVQITEGFY